jgi:hypothetical protein
MSACAASQKTQKWQNNTYQNSEVETCFSFRKNLYIFRILLHKLSQMVHLNLPLR